MKKLRENFYIYYKNNNFILENVDTRDVYVLEPEILAKMTDANEINNNPVFEEAGIVSSEETKQEVLPFGLPVKIFRSASIINQENLDKEADYFKAYIALSEDIIKNFPALKEDFRIFNSRFNERYKLPAPMPIHADFYDLLKKRKTVRDFNGEFITEQQLSDILFTSFGKFHESFNNQHLDIDSSIVWRRSSPSAGSMNCINAYVGIHKVKGIEPGVYFYDSLTHELCLIKEGIFEQEFAFNFLAQDFAVGCAASIFAVANLRKLTIKYPFDKAYVFPYLDNGHLMQTAILSAVALGLKNWITGALTDDYFRNIFNLLDYENLISCVCIGHGSDNSLAQRHIDKIHEVYMERDMLAKSLAKQKVEVVHEVHETEAKNEK